MIEYENLALSNKPFQQEYERAFKEVSEGGWYILGKKVANFEMEYAEFCGSDFCIGVANGMDALFLSLIALDLPKGSEIMVPSNTYIATILAILKADCTPVLVEPDIHTYTIDPDKIEEKITSLTKVIMVVHLYGKVCKMDKITEIANKNKLHIVEDCAQAHGAKFKNIQAGNFGVLGAFSFYPTKNLGALGDGGGITTNTAELATKLKTLRNYGSQKKYYNDIIGYNSRLDEIQAALLSIKLKKLNSINEHKRKLAKLYLAHLKEDFICPVEHIDYFDVYHIFNIRHPKRDLLKDYLLKNGVKTEIHYPVPPVKQIGMQGILDNFICPIAEEIHQTTLSLPISYFHTENAIFKIISILNRF